MEKEMGEMKVLACKDAGIDCDFVARGETNKEVIDMAMSHVRKVHPDKLDEMMVDMDEKEIRDMMEGMVK